MKTPVLLWASLALSFFITARASAQTDDVLPRMVAEAGDTTIGVSGFVDKFMSSENVFATQLTAHVDVGRFLTSHFAVRGGLIGSTSLGGDDDHPTGPGAFAFHALGGLFYYFTPGSMASLYTGGEYRVPLTSRAERDAGTLFGKIGVEAALASRFNVFVEGGYGFHLTRGEDDERLKRIVGEVGFRIRF